MTTVHALPAAFLTFATFLYCGQSQAGQSLQQGFYSHEPEGVALSISNASLGVVCGETLDQANVCDPRTKILITGETSCTGSDGNQHLCTRYGYEYDYRGATPGTTMQCRLTRNDGLRKQSTEYTLTLENAHGSILRPSWLAYQRVERRAMLTEVHECSYQGELLTTVEFILTYEPGVSSAPPPVAEEPGPSRDIDEPYIEEVPQACNYLTRDLATKWVRDEDVQNNSTADMHVPSLQSVCMYTAIHGADRDGRIQFKFHLYDFFNVKKLAPMQLLFHATFLGGGNEPQDTLHDLGKISFVYDLPNDVTSLLVVTGMQGPPDGAGRTMEFTASYYLRDPGRTHEDRLALLLEEARENLESWKFQYR